MSITPDSVNPRSRALQWTWWLALLLVPLAIELVWGDYLADAAYLTFRHARNLALGAAWLMVYCQAINFCFNHLSMRWC